MKAESPTGHVEMPPDDPVLVWRPARAAPPLGPGDLHLWRIETARGEETGQGLPPLAALASCLAILDQGQRARAARMGKAAYRERWVRAQAGLRWILGLYLQVDPGRLVFQRGAVGKPGLDPRLRMPGGARLEFNLTTTADIALVGISLESPLGVDCERLRPRREMMAVARRMFAPRTVTELTRLPEVQRLAAFYRAWTALESDAKADGRGLFRARPPGAKPPEILHAVPAAGHIAAVARERLPPVTAWLALDLVWHP